MMRGKRGIAEDGRSVDAARTYGDCGNLEFECGMRNSIRNLHSELKTMPKFHLTLTVNGEQHELLIDPRRSLLEGCATSLICARASRCDSGDCRRGRCGSAPAGDSRVWYWPPIVKAEVVTVEGVSINGELHLVQRALVEQGGIQCGFCTPGIVMMIDRAAQDNPHPTEDEVRLAWQSALQATRNC
jgi:carbon-monoxide dehydrogenase small subunit